MGVYLSIVSGAIKLFNYLAAALQQHHDEMNGRRAQLVDDLTESAKAQNNAAQAMVNTSDNSVSDSLRNDRF